MEIRNPPILETESTIHRLQSQATENKSLASTKANTFMRSRHSNNARLTPIINNGYKSTLVSPYNENVSQTIFNNTNSRNL